MLDVGIDLASQVLEVGCSERAHGRNDQDTFVLQQLTLDHLGHSESDKISRRDRSHAVISRSSIGVADAEGRCLPPVTSSGH